MWHFDPAKATWLVGIVTSVTEALKNFFEWLQAHATPGTFWEKLWGFWAHSIGPVILAALVSVVALLPGFVADGELTMMELWQLIAAATGLTAGASGLFTLLKKLRPKPRPTEPQSTATVTYTPAN